MKSSYKCLDCGTVVTGPWQRIPDMATEHEDAHRHITIVRDGLYGLYVRNSNCEWTHVE